MKDKKDMYYNFDMIIPRLEDSFNHTDLEHANRVLNGIKHNCICIGTGGSNSASLYASIILEEANNIITVSKEPRDILYMNLFNGYSNILAITYGNRNFGINEALTRARDKKLVDHTITMDSNYEDDICYKGELPHENSFISLASTIIPSSLMLNYYLNKYKSMKQDEVLSLIKDIYNNSNPINNNLNINGSLEVFEIMTGDDTYFASHILESTIVEAGLGIPVLHEKYSYCHGRTSLSYTLKNSNLIYLLNGKITDLDKVILDNASNYYKNVIILKSENENWVIGQFDLAIKSFQLLKSIAEKENKDLSIVNYSPFVKKLYYFKGNM